MLAFAMTTDNFKCSFYFCKCKDAVQGSFRAIITLQRDVFKEKNSLPFLRLDQQTSKVFDSLKLDIHQAN